jgi:uncharacterized tellurite resistance protein B-like protein
MITKKTEYLSALIALARADGEVDKSEVDLIKDIAFEKGWTSADIELAFLQEDYEPKEYFDWTFEEKSSFFHDLVHLMKIDGKIYNQELAFVSILAEKLGYNDRDLVDFFTMDHNVEEKVFEERLQELLAV